MGIIVHLLADSTTDNPYWLLNDKGTNIDEAKEGSVEGQLKKLSNNPLKPYHVISHAYDGFTTSSVLQGDNIGRVLYIGSGHSLTSQQRAYLQIKGKNQSSLHVHPLKDLKESINNYPGKIHWVVISIGGNDFRERLHDPIGMFRQIPEVRRLYLQILEEIKSIKDRNVRPILMFQYRTDANNDPYRIYKILGFLGKLAAAIHLLCIATFAASVTAISARKINTYLGGVFSLVSMTCLILSHRVIPLKVTVGILKRQHSGIATLGALIEKFYRPLLIQAREDKIPVLDLSNTFNPFEDLYISGIEPGKKGAALIAEGIDHIVQSHIHMQSIVYSTQNSDKGYIGRYNDHPESWQVEYPSKRAEV